MQQNEAVVRSTRFAEDAFTLKRIGAFCGRRRQPSTRRVRMWRGTDQNEEGSSWRRQLSKKHTQTPGRPGARKKPMTLDEAAALLVPQYRLLIEPGQVVELRALDVKGNGRPHTEAGFFDSDHLLQMARAALQITNHAKGVYFTLNPLHPDLLARRCNRIDWAGEGELAKDKDVIRRRWLLIDADPVRDPLISSNDEEKAVALYTVGAVRDTCVRARGPTPSWPTAGNGYHLLYRIDLAADDGACVERILRVLAARFNNDQVKIDQKVFNPSRICKLPGTLARKGDSTPTRPHRRANCWRFQADE